MEVNWLYAIKQIQIKLALLILLTQTMLTKTTKTTKKDLRSLMETKLIISASNNGKFGKSSLKSDRNNRKINIIQTIKCLI
jgi:hypothetical protein